jgi:hypothetical protein
MLVPRTVLLDINPQFNLCRNKAIPVGLICYYRTELGKILQLSNGIRPIKN